MKPYRWPIVWQRRLVGWLEDPQFDMPHTYGKWIPNGQDGADFIAALTDETNEDPDYLEVTLGDNWQHGASDPPDEGGIIDFRWRLRVEQKSKKWWQFWRSK